MEQLILVLAQQRGVVVALGLKKNNSKTSRVTYGGREHLGPTSLYRSVESLPAVELGTFCTRFRRLVNAGDLSSASIEEALSSSIEDYGQRYRVRKTIVQVNGERVDLRSYFDASVVTERVEYCNFRQRARSLEKREALDGDTLLHALTLDAQSWHTFYGGGRHRTFVYEGEEYPSQYGSRFHGVSSFLLTVGRYADRQLVWSRLKTGWNLDDALAVPVAFPSKRDGLIYRVTRRKTGAVYVGLTSTTVDQRWAMHIRNAARRATNKLARAIREDGPNGFELEVLESGIRDVDVLKSREVYWVSHLDALGPHGLNTAPAGGVGSSRGKLCEYEGEQFWSKKERAAVLGERFGLMPHVVSTRIEQGKSLPRAGEVRRHSRHPEAGSPLFRRWLGLLKRHGADVSSEWIEDFDRFSEDVSPIPAGLELVRKCQCEPWGPANFEWVDTQTKIERTHGKEYFVHGVLYPSLQAIANTCGFGVSTLRYRITRLGMSVEQAVEMPLAATSCKKQTHWRSLLASPSNQSVR